MYCVTIFGVPVTGVLGGHKTSEMKQSLVVHEKNIRLTVLSWTDCNTKNETSCTQLYPQESTSAPLTLRNFETQEPLDFFFYGATARCQALASLIKPPHSSLSCAALFQFLTPINFFASSSTASVLLVLGFPTLDLLEQNFFGTLHSFPS
jgi:hypothetical protein